jgi:cellulose biosynthesis protein BcsQ
MKIVRFNDALRIAALAATDAGLPEQWPVGLVRDVYGRLRFAVNAERAEYPEYARLQLESHTAELGAFATSKQVLFRDDFSDADALFSHADWHQTLVVGSADGEGGLAQEISVRLLDRQVTGQDWLRTEASESAEAHPPRIVFYGLKGGVGRSTALAMLAYRLARDGKRVLLIDFDLESPGLSGLLLPEDRVAPFGLVDWFVEDAVGQADGVLSDLVADSPLAEQSTGAIRIAAAMGNGETAYLSKLARVYADVPKPGGVERFAQRMQRVVEALEAQEKPDFVLIDSRAGLHDVAAVSIAGLATVALLFATNSPQNWQGYRQLFAHWQQRPEVLRHIRSRLAIVQALFPETEQAARAARFVQQSYDLFADHLYDQIEPGDTTPTDAFTFDMNDQAAPHFPWRVRWSARLQEFDPLLRVEDGGADNTDIELAFGPFFQEVISAVSGG